jgi:hypothetical protein
MLARMEDWNNTRMGKSKILWAKMNEIATTCFQHFSIRLIYMNLLE